MLILIKRRIEKKHSNLCIAIHNYFDHLIFWNSIQLKIIEWFSNNILKCISHKERRNVMMSKNYKSGMKRVEPH